MGDMDCFANWFRDKIFSIGFSLGWNGYDNKRKTDLSVAKRTDAVKDKTGVDWNNVRKEIKGGKGNG